MPARSPRFGIVVSRFNRELTNQLVEGARKSLRAHRVPDSRVDVVWVPGAFELPYAAMKLASSKRYDAVIALGCILAGETPQFQFLSEATFTGLVTAGVITGVPVTCGVITAKRWSHARERASARGINRGGEAAEAAWELSRAR